jgi:hypothetical protein
MKTCPFCAEEIQDAAVVCKHCGRELTASSSAARPAMPSLPTARIPGARVFAKTCHLLALGWTAFCIVSVMVGMAAASNSLGGELSGAAAIGVGIGLGFWAFVWFVPVVGLEIVVLTATVTANQCLRTTARASVNGSGPSCSAPRRISYCCSQSSRASAAARHRARPRGAATTPRGAANLRSSASRWINSLSCAMG